MRAKNWLMSVFWSTISMVKHTLARRMETTVADGHFEVEYNSESSSSRAGLLVSELQGNASSSDLSHLLLLQPQLSSKNQEGCSSARHHFVLYSYITPWLATLWSLLGHAVTSERDPDASGRREAAADRRQEEASFSPFSKSHSTDGWDASIGGYL